MRLKISGGHLFDPASGLNGQVGDLYIAGNRLVPPLDEVDEVLDARGLAVLAGGIALRASVAGFGQHLLSLRGEGASPRALGEAYARLGYTHVHEPCLTLTTAGVVHRQLQALAVVDASASLVVNLRELDLALQDPIRLPEVGDTLCHLLERTRCLQLSVAEPFVRYRQEFYAHRTLAPAAALDLLAAVAARHDLRLGLEAGPELPAWPLPAPERFHLSGLSLGLVGEEQVEAARALLATGATADLGLALPEPEGLAVTVDLGWFAPRRLNARPTPAAVRRVLELALEDPGSNLAYSSLGPASRLAADHRRLAAWLMDAHSREREGLGPVDHRQWSLADWAHATRALPARVLGLADRGRLSPGARADLALYDLPPENRRDRWSPCLSRCRTLIKAGQVVIRDFQLVGSDVPRHTVFRRTGAPETPLLEELCRLPSFRPANLWMAEALGGPWAGI
jgi:formylmethanofuran dehydrogenase subunit A